MLELQLQHQLGRIGLNISPPQYDFKVTKPDLQIQQKPAQVAIEQPAAVIDINYKSALSSIGLYNVEDLMRTSVQKAYQTASDGRDRVVSDGDQLSDLSQNISIGQLEGQHFLNPAQKELILAHTDLAQVQVQPAPVKVDIQPMGVTQNLTYGSVKGNLTLGSVKVYWEQAPQFEARVVGSLVDTRV